jgi:predicted nuclease of predicted toxin-antitoxin system
VTILLDHGVPRRYLRLLVEWGYTATVSSMHISAAAADSDVIELAQRMDGVLLTVDLDFANVLAYPPADFGGIIVLRYKPQDELRLDQTLHQALTDLYRDRFRGVLVIVGAGRYRIRR